ncbi:MAG TPA: DNA polymerase III subunit delta [Candidatus Acidoferrales bacterium]|nr:DNA polymerase III subunit delta [Candidatus Acidoferrales bacterium]
MPQSSIENLLERIANGKPIPAILLLGSEPYLSDRCRSAIIEKFIPEGAREWAVTRIAASSDGLAELLGRARMMPMLAPAQILILQESEALERGGDEASEKSAELLSEYLADPAPFSIVIFEAASLDKRRKLYKALADKALVVELSIGGANVAALAVDMARELGAEIAPDAAAELAEAVNGEISKVRLELEKLSLFASGRRIEVADVEALVVSAQKFTVWKLAEVLAARDRRAAMDFLDGVLRAGEQPAPIVGAMAWMYRKLIEAREMPAGTQPFQAARDLGTRPETAAIALTQSRRMSRQALLQGLVELAEADSELKSGRPNPRAILEFLIAKLTSEGRASAA